MIEHPRPPRIIAGLLRLFLPKKDQEYLIGDLEEEFLETEIHRQSPLSARLWFWRNSLSLLGSLAWVRIRKGRNRDLSVVLEARRYRFRFIKREQTRERDLRMTIQQDLHFGIRMLLKRPAFTIAAVLCIGLGIGANGAIIPFLKGIVLDPLPYSDPNRLVRVQGSNPEQGFATVPVSYPDFLDLRDQTEALSDLAVYTGRNPVLTGQGEPEQINGIICSCNLPALLGKEPILGRLMRPEEDMPGSEGVVLIGEGLWRRRFGGDPNLLGQTVVLDAESYTVIGIMPLDFRFPSRSEIWMPLRRSPAEERGNFNLGMIGRLNPGMTLAAARGDLAAIAGRLEEQYPDTNTGIRFSMETLKSWLNRDGAAQVLIFQGVVFFILLLACANVANLLLARSAERRQEITVRATLGAGRGRIIRQLITESLLLAMAGGMLGLVLGRIGMDLMIVGLPVDLPPIYDISFSFTVVLTLIGITAFCGAIFGLAPALMTSRSNLMGTLHSGSGRTAGDFRRSRFRSFLIVSQIALTLTVLIGASLMLKGLTLLKDVDTGFAPENLLVIEVSPRGGGYEEEQQQILFYQDLLRSVRAVPGVIDAAAAWNTPTGQAGWWTAVYIEGTEPPPPGDAPIAASNTVTAGYLRTAGIPLLRGRDFNDSDTFEGSPRVMIVNEAFARRWWPDEDPIGRRFVMDSAPPESEDEWIEVVGVAGNVHTTGYGDPIRPAIYRPHTQYPLSEMELILRTAADPLDMVDPVRTAIWSLNTDIPLANVRTMERVLLDRHWDQYFYTVLFWVFSLVALLMAVAGVYGVIAYTVGQRSREFGIRTALGADPSSLLAAALRQGVFLTLIGLGVGLLLAFGVMRFVTSMMFGVSPTDPVVYGISVLALGTVAILAGYIPARRVMQVNPLEALRNE